MKWFQHQTYASDDIKLQRLELEFGLKGYAIYFKLLEKVGSEGSNFVLDLNKYPVRILARSMNSKFTFVHRILTKMNELNLIVFTESSISVPNMCKYAAEYDKYRKIENPKSPSIGTSKSQACINRIDNRIEQKNSDKSLVPLLKEEGSPHKEIINYFYQQVKDCKGFTPEINGYKDGKRLKDTLKRYSVKQLKDLIDYYLESEKSDKLAISLSTALSTDTINHWQQDEEAII